MPVVTRKVYGYLYDLDGNAVYNAVVRAGVYEQPLLDVTLEAGIVADWIETTSTSTGYFSLNLPRGFTIWLSIPSLNYKEDIFIPDESGDINFISLTPSS